MGAMKAVAGRYLTFSLGAEVYAIPVERVEVVLETPVITRVPNVADHMRGVINHRGSVIPVVDPRLRFGGTSIMIEASPSVIVLQIEYEGEDVMIGMLADSVSEVVDIAPEAIGPAPALGAKTSGDFISGVARNGNAFLVMLDVDAAFARSSEQAAKTIP
ncbi:MAG TPA: chemotaxis protein CheW [bacterium]|nr:chemotaxis protein CheW [bacterium]